jgi:hypothetical protein
MYSVMAIFKSSIVWGLFEYPGSTGAQRLFDLEECGRWEVSVVWCQPVGLMQVFRRGGWLVMISIETVYMILEFLNSKFRRVLTD